jgi:hypothetical protein
VFNSDPAMAKATFARHITSFENQTVEWRLVSAGLLTLAGLRSSFQSPLTICP